MATGYKLQNGLFSPTQTLFDAPLEGARYNFRMKLIQQKLEGCGYRTVKIG